MRMKKCIVSGLVCVLLVVAAVAVAWRFAEPYPIEMWLEGRRDARFSEGWPVSRSDFAAAKRLVKSELVFPEIIWEVQVISLKRIEFRTLRGYRGPLWAAGRFTTAEKREDTAVLSGRDSWRS